MFSDRDEPCCCESAGVEALSESALVPACHGEQRQSRTGSGAAIGWQRDIVVKPGLAIRYLRKGDYGEDIAFYFCTSCGAPLPNGSLASSLA